MLLFYTPSILDRDQFRRCINKVVHPDLRKLLLLAIARALQWCLRQFALIFVEVLGVSSTDNHWELLELTLLCTHGVAYTEWSLVALRECLPMSEEIPQMTAPPHADQRICDVSRIWFDAAEASNKIFFFFFYICF